MNTTRFQRILLTLCGALLPVAGCRALEAGVYADEPGVPGLSPDSRVMIVPAHFAGESMRDIADVIGLMLEQDGMPQIATTDAAFTPADDASLDDLAKSFGTWVAARKFDSDAVLFAQVRGSHAEGVRDFRIVLVDPAGKPLWQGREAAGDATFDRIRPHNPMSCCVLVRDRLRPRFHLKPELRGRVENGPMERRWAEKSGTPSDEEEQAMDTRFAQFRQDFGNVPLRIYPVQRDGKGGAGMTTALATKLNGALTARAEVVATELDLPIEPNRNEQKRLWDLARAFRDHLRKQPAGAGYSMVAEYTIRPDGVVWAVHFVVCDAAGEWVLVDFQNNHHADFNAVNPRDTDDCATLVARRLKGRLGR